MNWSVSYTPWGDRIVCHLTINGVTRSSTGEPDSQSEKSEIAGTAAEAQAFKRACAMFGLGRYLYNLPSVWAEYDSERRQFSEQGKARLNGIIVQHYRRYLGEDLQDLEPEASNQQPEPDGEPVAAAQTGPALAEPKDAAEAPSQSANGNGTEKKPHRNGSRGTSNGHGKTAAVVAEAQEDLAGPNPAPKKLHTEFNKLGAEIYGEQWEQVRRHNVERISGGSVSNSEELSEEAVKKLITGLKKLKRQRGPESIAA